jgi:hypothetical protein
MVLSFNANASTYYGSYTGKYGDGFGYSLDVWKKSSGSNQFTYKFTGSSWKDKEDSNNFKNSFDAFDHNRYWSSDRNWSSYDIACFVNDERKHHGSSYDNNYGAVPLPAAAPLFASALALFGFIAHRRRKN